MKRFFIGLGSFGALLFVLLIIARFTGMLQFYRIPTPSNHPTLKIGDWVTTSSLKKPEPYRFIAYTSEYIDSLEAGYGRAGSIYLHRLCAVPGDLIEMKDGVLFVNHKNFDNPLRLAKQYKITDTAYQSIDQEDINENEPIGNFMLLRDSVLVTFDDRLLNKYRSRIKLTPFIFNDTVGGCFKWYNRNSLWTPDNFGPLKIPPACYFVLGDNRHNALDSRYAGFIKRKNIKGTVLNK